MKISIITATWNSEGTIRSTMESVLSQSYTDYEHIIIDGRSSDSTMDIVKDMEPLYNGKLRYLCESDEGLYDAMNKGINMASGDVIGLLNSDDFYTTGDILSKIAETMTIRQDIDALYGDIHYVENNDLSKCVRYYSSKMFRRFWMRLGFMPAHPSFYCRKSIYMKYGTFDTSYKIAADFENLLRLIFVNRIKTLYVPLDFVTMRKGGVTTSGIASHKKIMSDHIRALKQNGVYSNRALLCLRYLYKIFEIAKTKLTIA